MAPTKSVLEHAVAAAKAVSFRCPDCAPGESHAAPPCPCGSERLTLLFQGGKRTYFRCQQCGAEVVERHIDDHLPL